MSSNTVSQKLKQISQKDIEMVQGNYEIYRADIKVKNYVTRVLEPYDLTGIQEITMIIEDKSSGTVHFSGTLSNSDITIEDAANGQFRVDIDDSVTSNIPPGNWWYHIFITIPTDKPRTAVLGRIRVVDD